MTIKLPDPSVLDSFLYFLRKRRGVVIPKESYRNHGSYAYVTGQKESFFKALFRPKNASLPYGMIDIFENHKRRKNHSNK